MKHTILLLGAVLTALQPAFAADRLGREQALKVAFLLAGDLNHLQTTSIPTDVDLKHPVAVHEGEYGALVLPEAKLTREALARAGREPVAVGQLWLRKLTPVADGEAVPGAKLRLIKLRVEDRDETAVQLALAVGRREGGDLELLVFSKDREPLLRASLKAVDRAQSVPVDVEAERTDGDGGRLTLRLLGRHEAVLAVTAFEE